MAYRYTPDTLSLAAQRLYGQWQHLEIDGEAEGWPWAVLAAACARPIDPLYDLLAGAEVPWAPLFDPELAAEVLQPEFATQLLAYLGQFAGLRQRTDLPALGQRLRLSETGNARRGSPSAIVAAARQRAIGPDGTPDTATVILLERVGGDPYHFAVTMYEGEVPDPDGTRRDIEAETPAGRRGTVPADVTNLIRNPSGEVTPTAVSSSASSAGQPAATIVDTTEWARVGDHASRYTVAKTDGSTVTARTAPGAGGIAVTATHFYAVRISTHLASLAGAPALEDWRAVIYWYKADGLASAVTTLSSRYEQDAGGAARQPAAGAHADQFLIAQAPSDAVTAAVGVYLNTPLPVAPAAAVSLVCDVDAFALFDLGAAFAGPVGQATDEADVPDYADGTFPNFAWTGAAHASTSTGHPEAPRFDFNLVTGGNFATLAGAFATFDDVTAAFATFDALTANPLGI